MPFDLLYFGNLFLKIMRLIACILFSLSKFDRFKGIFHGILLLLGFFEEFA